MIEWLYENWGSIVAMAVVILMVLLAVRSMINDKKAGKSSCGGNCGACGACKCASCSGCHPVKKACEKNSSFSKK